MGAAAHIVDITSQVASQQAQSQLAALLSQGTYGYLLERIDGTIADTNDALTTMAGVSRADLLSGARTFTRHPDDEPRIRSIVASLTDGTRTTATFHARYQRPDASVWWAEISVSALHDPAGEVIGFAKLIRDITDELAEWRRLRGVEALWAELVHNSTSGYVVATPGGDVVDCNSALEGMLDRPRSELIGHPVLSLIADGDQAFARENLAKALAGAGPAQWRVRLARPAGDTFWVDLHPNPVHDSKGQVVNVGCVVQDARTEVAAEQRAALAEADLIHRSTHDSLTGVLHRAAVLDHVRKALNSAEPATLMFVDMDGFKSVNDHLGHPAGDTLLRVLAERIVAEVPEVAVVGRLGGDEFAIVLPGKGQSSRDMEIAEAVLERLRDPVEIEGSPIQLTASIGLAAIVGAESATDEVLRNADLAMYAAKSAGGDRIRRFSADLADRAVVASRLRNELAAAIRGGGFDLDYQSIVDLHNNSVVGAEALVRLRRGTVRVPAGAFVTLAEQTGQIVGIGRIVLDTLAVDIARLRPVMPPGWFVTVNVSAKELADPDIITRLVDGPLAACAQSIYLEVTEGLELASQDDTMSTLRALRDGGYRIAIDDFGTGYSNFERLGELRPDLFKIDRSLVVGARTMTGSGNALLAAAVGVARTLRCRVLAEGVETFADHRVVTDLPIDFGQGFHYSRPAPLSSLLAGPGAGDPTTAT